jgi:hypothetical protein
MMFERLIEALGQLAQLVRAFGSHPRGHWFESSIAQIKKMSEMTDKKTMCLPFKMRRANKAGLDIDRGKTTAQS